MEAGLTGWRKAEYSTGGGDAYLSFLRVRVESEERSAQKFYYRVGDETQGLDLGEQKVREYL